MAATTAETRQSGWQRVSQAHRGAAPAIVATATALPEERRRLPVVDHDASVPPAGSIDAAFALGERAVEAILARTRIAPDEVGLVVTATTDLVPPSLQRRLRGSAELGSSLVRVPLIGLGWLGAPAALALAADWLRAYPERCAVVVSVELATGTAPHLGGGAAAALLAGADHALNWQRSPAPTARVLASRSEFFPEIEQAAGGELHMPSVALQRVRRAVDAFLSEHDLTRSEIGTWLLQAEGPLTTEALEDGLGLGRSLLAESRGDGGAPAQDRRSSSLLRLLDERCCGSMPRQGTYAVMLAVGPAHCAEFVLLRFDGGAW